MVLIGIVSDSSPIISFVDIAIVAVRGGDISLLFVRSGLFGRERRMSISKIGQLFHSTHRIAMVLVGI